MRIYYARMHKICKYVKYQSFNMRTEKKGKQVTKGKPFCFALREEIGKVELPKSKNGSA